MRVIIIEPEEDMDALPKFKDKKMDHQEEVLRDRTKGNSSRNCVVERCTVQEAEVITGESNEF